MNIYEKAFGINILLNQKPIETKENEWVVYRPALSMKELNERYKLGKLLYSDDPWYKNEAFYTKKMTPGWYVTTKGCAGGKNMNFEQQENIIPEGYTRKSTAEALYDMALVYAETGEYPIWEYEWTSSRSSDGRLVHVGPFDASGARVDYWSPGSAVGDLGVSFSRSLDLCTLPLESLPSELEINGKTYVEKNHVHIESTELKEIRSELMSLSNKVSGYLKKHHE